LAEATRLLKNVEGIGIVTYTANDVIRHELVARIVEAYDNDTRKIARMRESNE
jgi:phosphate starvation-inducible protein PhoH and related proteins